MPTDALDGDRLERRTRDRREKASTSDGSVKWLMGIVAAVLGGILIGWYNDVRELRPDVAVLKSQMQELSIQVRTTNTRLEVLTEAIVRDTQQRREDDARVRR